MTDPALTACCSSRRYMDPLIVMPQNVTFARVPRCAACHKFKGPVSVLYTAPKDLAAKWTGTSEAAMLDAHSKVPGRPLWFEDGGKFLKPVGWKPAQAELPDQEVPF
jgi:hypothetical protein